MMESKEGKYDNNIDEDDDHEEEDVIDVTSIKFLNGSNLCPVQDALEFEVTFNALRPIEEACWEIKYLVDSIQKRNIIILGRTNEVDYHGSSKLHFQVDSVNVSHIKPSQLSNAGLLICTLIEHGSKEIAEIKMVVQVEKQTPSGEFMRCIYNPLE